MPSTKPVEKDHDEEERPHNDAAENLAEQAKQHADDKGRGPRTRQKTGEGPDHLKRRSEWFKKRH